MRIACRISRRTGLRRGVILITALWVLSILAFLAWNLVQRVRIEMALADYRSDDLEVEAWMDAALARALWALREPRDEDANHYGEIWAAAPALTEEALLSRDGGGKEKEGVTVDWRVEDEAGKINLNLASEAVMQSLFETYYGSDVEAELLAKCIVDWTDRDDEGPGERDYYLSLPAPHLPANDAMADLEELLLVRGVTPELFESGPPAGSRKDAAQPWNFPESEEDDDAAPGLVRLLTVEGDGTLNVNTAPRRVLEAVFRTMSDVAEAGALARQMDERRRGEDGKFGTDDDSPFLSTGEVTEFVSDSIFQQAAAAGVPLGVVASAFTVRVSVAMEAARIERTGWARVRGEGEGVQLVAWHRDRFSRQRNQP